VLGLFAGLICASAIFMFFVQLDRATVVAGELPPDDELRAIARKRRTLGYQLDRLGRRLAQGMPDERRQQIQADLNLAGNPGGLTPSGFQAARIALAALLAALGLAAGLFVGAATSSIALGAIGAGAGYYVPTLVLSQLAGSRKREIERNLPDAVDLLTLAVDAGLSLDAGMADITARFNNALGDEFAKVLREVRLGRPRLVALEDMGRRCGVPELHNLVQAITQSEQMGIGISRTLRVQAAELRRQRRQKSQESAARASLKMIFPMVGCIFPTIWIILLGPALLGVVKAWH
jgi:tight adherence protein C